MNPVNPLNHRRLTLIEVLQPQCFKTTPERSRVTRTIVQPEIDAFEQMEAQAGAEKSAHPKGTSCGALVGRQPELMNQTQRVASQLTPQLIGA